MLAVTFSLIQKQSSEGVLKKIITTVPGSLIKVAGLRPGTLFKKSFGTGVFL